MVNMNDLHELASQAWAMEDVGDEYADKRRRWCFDPAHKDEHMWWGKDQPYYKFLYLLSK